MLVILLFLRHIPSALIPAITIPVAVLLSFIPFRQLGVTANIMSLGGIAIAIGALVDAAIVVVEQTHKKLEEWEAHGRVGEYRDVVIAAVKEVAGPSFFALLVIGVSFLPVLALEAQEGRLFKPLAYTKTLAMVVAAVLAITLDPALRLTLTHLRNFDFHPRWLAKAASALLVGKIRAEQSHPVSRFLVRSYEPVVRWSLRHRRLVIAAALGLVLCTVPVALRLGSEFMPPLDEGALLYMPSAMPGISITEAQRLLQVTDRIIRQFPEVDRVLGKAGRADTATDPAPLSMLETLITLKPKSRWRRVSTWYSGWAPEWLKPVFRHLTPDNISQDRLVAEMNGALAVPGVTNAWTMPIKGRIDMLTTGVRTPVGVKVLGSDSQEVGRIGERVEGALRSVPGARSVFAERTGDGYFLDIAWNRELLARYGLTIEEADETLSSAIGGENVTTTVEGRARYPVNVRYMRDFRSDIEAIGRVLVPSGDGKRQIPLADLATVRTNSGPAMIRDEDGLITGYVYVDVAGRDISGFVEDGKRALAEKLRLPPGYSIRWTGQYEAMERVRERLRVVVPVTLFLVLLLLWLNTRSLAKSTIVLLAVPFSAVGAFWFLYALGYNLSVAVWVGLIALMGVDAETGVFMLLYLDLAFERAVREGRMSSRADLHEAIVAGAARRIRPKFMTVATMFVGLVPILWSTGTGADVMKRIAAPMVGGIFTSFLLELLVYPAIYDVWRWRGRPIGKAG
jgi:Cu(I)/Ag(I) efflux system membrane protein CusA/SilA